MYIIYYLKILLITRMEIMPEMWYYNDDENKKNRKINKKHDNNENTVPNVVFRRRNRF